MSALHPTRVSAGVPAGGQFATGPRTEPNVRLLPLPLQAAVPERGSYDLSAAEVAAVTDDLPFSTVSISRIRGTDTFRVTGTREISLDRLGQAMPTPPGTPNEIADYLSENAESVERHLDQRYATVIGETSESFGNDWAQRTLTLSTDVACDADVTSAVESLGRAWGVSTLRDDLAGDGHDFYEGLTAAVRDAEEMVDDHAYGIHDDDPMPATCPECAKRLARLDDMADAIRKGEW